ncbi:uncharacterized protein LOC126681636 [Mercurialis annua]|uniref:uncharacterized protein LOC126681636 n=1 Tax=Mercurialis annua TaxID=3986 RepID=UPI00215F0E5E|nr:uncharacterized protein LOC126681636 [Mercurialis annua]
MTFKMDEFLSIPIWVHFPRLPWEFWSNSMLGKIASMCGRPMHTDQCTRHQTRLAYARVLGEMEIFGEFPNEVILEDENGETFIQEVVYEWMPSGCSNCKVMGHTDFSCKVGQSKKTWVPKNPGEVESKETVVAGIEGKMGDEGSKESQGLSKLNEEEKGVSQQLVTEDEPGTSNFIVVQKQNKPAASLAKGKNKAPVITATGNRFEIPGMNRLGIIGDKRVKKVNITPERGK